ncbi:MAG: Gfo/Idh/MocA family oxidoreductase [Chloroflexi bacterium]|nr:MAG: Gfo/Idh/MocA family oxidoreductase [Chloroflexota bacterium]TMF38248.1 MAG: Gfo/Idh/MocA family oxidoreductase [Chloroflexota bacterium]
MTAGDVGIGIVGYGMMGKAHSFGYTVAPVMRPLRHRPHLRVISGRDREKVASAAAAYGIGTWLDDWRELVQRPDVDIVDICTPPGSHAEIAAAAAAAGKAVICEKPLAVSYLQAAAAVAAVEKAHVLNAVGFNYRRLPAVSLMKRMIDEGAVGEIRLLRATWLSDEFVDPAIPFDWRFDRSIGGTTIADLGSHVIDMTTWMAGPIAEVSGQSVTFVRERSGRKVTVDDASSALVRFDSGARGVFEMARTAVRRPCDFTLEVNGDRGTLVFEYARLNELRYGDGGDRSELYGMRRIRAEHPLHPYARDWWPIGQGVGYGSSFVNHLGDLLDRWPDKPWEPDFAQGAAVQAVCDAIERSAAERRWVEVAEVMDNRTPSPAASPPPTHKVGR